jgi:hypothetical protein
MERVPPAPLRILKGEKGDKGDPGDPGTPGADGEDGLSAYEVSVANGFVGTEVEWLASLQGEQGEPGSGGGSTAWGGITGTLPNQTDLQNALNAKANTSALADYSPATHTHDAAYSPLGHTHSYAATGHTHDYAATSHTHDYAATSHSHNDLYFTETESDARFASLSHTHGVSDLTATGTRDATTILYGDNTWKIAPTGGSAPAWGSITGTLANQSDLNTALGDKASAATLATHTGETAAHGATGAVVGTTNTQTLTNKTLTAPAISSPTGLVKADVGLANVDNTSDVNKPVSTAQQTAIDALKTVAINAQIDNGSTVIAAASYVDIAIPFAGTVTGWRIFSPNQAGSAVVTVSRATYANYPTFTAISGTEKPTLSSAQKAEDLTLTTWTTTLAAGDILRFAVDSATASTRLAIVVFVTRA